MNDKEIIVIDNPDKAFLKPQKNPLLPKGGSRIILSSRPGSGKGCVVKQIIMHMDPPFERICLLHIDKSTLEWDDCDVEKIDLDDVEHGFFNREISNCLILDEYDFEGCSRQQRGKLDRIFQYTASHYNLTVFCLQQNFCSIPVNVNSRASGNSMVTGSVARFFPNVSFKSVALGMQKLFFAPVILSQIFKAVCPGTSIVVPFL